MDDNALKAKRGVLKTNRDTLKTVFDTQYAARYAQRREDKNIYHASRLIYTRTRTRGQAGRVTASPAPETRTAEAQQPCGDAAAGSGRGHKKT